MSLFESEEYINFRSSVPKKKLFVDNNSNLYWNLFDSGPKSIKYPILFLPPVSGTADIFYKQLIHLSKLGYRVISVDYPSYWSVDEFCRGLQKVINTLELLQVHIFGSSFGGFLALNFLEAYRYRQLVASLFLCNAFSDNTLLKSKPYTFKLMPKFTLKRTALNNITPTHVTKDSDCDHDDVIKFIDYMLNSLTQSNLAARLTCKYTKRYAKHLNCLQTFPVTIMHTFDDNIFYESSKEEICKSFPCAKMAHLKSGGRFPFLTQHENVNLHIKVHLRQFENTKKSPLIK